MPIPKILGFPIYKNLKKRIGEKHSKSYWKKYSKEIYTKFNNYKQGDILQTCSGLNEKIIEIEPIYYPVGNGFILIDFDIKFSRTFCSFKNSIGHPPRILLKHCFYILPLLPLKVGAKLRNF